MKLSFESVVFHDLKSSQKIWLKAYGDKKNLEINLTDNELSDDDDDEEEYSSDEEEETED